MKFPKTLSMIPAALITLAGCSGIHNIGPSSAPLGHPDAVTAKPEAPFVEAFLEFLAPPQRWAGPNSLVIHILTREQAAPEIVLTPALFKHVTAALEKDKRNQRNPAALHLTGVAARDELGRLAALMKNPDPQFFGCLHPIRVRLLRADGTVVEKQGCRGATGWPAAMSNLAAESIDATVVESNARIVAR